MFCPNCGTQNPDTAQTCSKCNFNVKAAPKFKGTMLMMNQQQGAFPGVPQAGPPGAPAPGAPVPPGPSAVGPTAPGATVPGAGGPPRAAGAMSAPMPSKLKGTMVGVAPPMPGGGGMPSPVAVPPAGMPGAPTPPPAYSPFGSTQAAPPPAAAAAQSVPTPYTATPAFDPAGSFSPPGGQPVNPLGGTVAADAGFPGSFGAPAGQSAYGPPPGAPPPYGAPPPAYGAPPPAAPGGYGAPPAGYGAPAPQAQGYGQPAGMVPAGQPQQGMAQYGQAAAGALAGTLQSAGIGGTVQPTKRNALMWWLVPFAIMVGGAVVGGILTAILAMASPTLGTIFGLLVPLALLAGAVLMLLRAIRMVNELKSVTRNDAFAWWPMFIPVYSMYWMWILVPQEVSKAKQALGVQTPTRSIVLYIFLWHFAFASDLNDMVR